MTDLEYAEREKRNSMSEDCGIECTSNSEDNKKQNMFL